MGYRRVGFRGMGDCVVDPVSGPTCDPSIVNPGFPTLASLTTGSVLTPAGVPVAATSFLGLSTTTWIMVGGGLALIMLVSGGGRR